MVDPTPLNNGAPASGEGGSQPDDSGLGLDPSSTKALADAKRLLARLQSQERATQSALARLRKEEGDVAKGKQENAELAEELRLQKENMIKQKEADLKEITEKIQTAEARISAAEAAETAARQEALRIKQEGEAQEQKIAANRATLKSEQAKVAADRQAAEELFEEALRTANGTKMNSAASNQPIDPNEERKLRAHHESVLTQYKNKNLRLIKHKTNDILDGLDFYFPHPDPKKEPTQKAWEVGHGGVVTIHGFSHPDAATRKEAFAQSIILAMALHEGNVASTDASGAMKAQMLAIAKELYANGELVGPDGKPLVDRNGQPLKQIIFDGVVLGDYGPNYGPSTPPKLNSGAAATQSAQPAASPTAKVTPGPGTSSRRVPPVRRWFGGLRKPQQKPTPSAGPSSAQPPGGQPTPKGSGRPRTQPTV